MSEEKAAKKKEEPTIEENKLEIVYSLVMDWLNVEMGNRITHNNSFALMHKVSETTGLPAPRFMNKQQEEPK